MKTDCLLEQRSRSTTGAINHRAVDILARLEDRADEIAEEIAACTVAEIDGFRCTNAQIRSLARQHLDAFLATARSDAPPSAAILATARQRAIIQARQMAPLSALVHSHMITQRVISAAIASAAAPDAPSRQAALTLTALTFDYNIAVTAAMTQAYVEVVQGDLAELDGARRNLIDALLSGDNRADRGLDDRATGLGFDPDRRYVTVVAVVDPPDNDPATDTTRWAASTIVRACGRPDRDVFVVSRERDLIALLDPTGHHSARTILDKAAAVIELTRHARLRAGIGTAFTGLDEFTSSYQQARRALKHTSQQRPFVVGPDDIRLFDELTTSMGEHAAALIPPHTRRLLSDHTLRTTLDAFIAANLNVATAAHALSLHPNSLRYRLKQITKITGRNPRNITDLLELVTAARILSATPTLKRSTT